MPNTRRRSSAQRSMKAVAATPGRTAAHSSRKVSCITAIRRCAGAGADQPAGCAEADFVAFDETIECRAHRGDDVGARGLIDTAQCETDRAQLAEVSDQ